MSGVARLPGFVESSSGSSVLIARSELANRLRELGFGTAAAWNAALARGGGTVGRGATARLDVPGGPALLLKRMRRGGLTARLWRDRYPGRRRLLANLSLPGEVARRGVPTPAAAALFLQPTGFGLHRAWFAMDAIDGAEDLRAVVGRGAGADEPALARAMALVRQMHDAGVEHHDLNLGNVLVRCDPDAVHAWIIDLDRARLHDRALGDRRRAAQLRRLERSYLKLFGATGPVGNAAVWRELYAAAGRSR